MIANIILGIAIGIIISWFSGCLILIYSLHKIKDICVFVLEKIEEQKEDNDDDGDTSENWKRIF